MANFQDTSKIQSDASKLSFQLVLRWLSSVLYFGALTVKCSLTNITTEKIANLQDTVLRFQRSVFRQFHSVYHETDILNLLR